MYFSKNCSVKEDFPILENGGDSSLDNIKEENSLDSKGDNYVDDKGDHSLDGEGGHSMDGEGDHSMVGEGDHSMDGEEIEESEDNREDPQQQSFLSFLNLKKGMCLSMHDKCVLTDFTDIIKNNGA